jgi:hypothetical protein
MTLDRYKFKKGGKIVCYSLGQIGSQQGGDSVPGIDDKGSQQDIA